MTRAQPYKRVARTAAVSLLTLVAALVAVWAAPRLSDAAAQWVGTPPVRSVEVALPAGVPVDSTTGSAAKAGGPGSSSSGAGAELTRGSTRRTVVDPGMRFTMIGLTCRPPARQGAVIVRLRTSSDGASWSRWYEVELERAAEIGGAQKAFTEPIWTDAGRYIQVTARIAGSVRAPEKLRGVRVVAINSTEDADRGAVVLGVIRRAAAAVAGIDLTPSADAMTTKPRIVTRTQWGADESWRRGSPSFAPVKMAFVHHTASGNAYTLSQSAAIVRGVYQYHTKSLHWSDVGYNFLIDRYGTIYEGRYGGVTKGALGAQTLGFNTGSTGISIIGSFTNVTPTSASVTALERLLEWKLDVHHVDAEGTATLVCGFGQKFKTGQRVRFPAIAGHRDANYTDCPGSRLYRLLPAVSKVVGRTGQPKIYGFVISEPAISPNADGVRDTTTFACTVSESADWRLTIRAADGGVVRHIEGRGTAVSTTWAGKDDAGGRLPDGTYTVEVSAVSASGTARPATETVSIDTAAPRLASIGATPDPFSPNGDGTDDVTTLAFRPAEAGSARTSVVGADGAVIRRLTDWKTLGVATQRVTWDGRVKAGSGLVAAPEGSATLAVELRDAAGNAATFHCRVSLDRTLGASSLSQRAFSPNGDERHDVVTLSFRLTRAAHVTATVLQDGRPVRTLKAGDLTAGHRSVVWDGTVTGGAVALSGSYQIRLTVDSVIGVSTVTQDVSVDLRRPRVSAQPDVAIRRGATARVRFTVRDGDSGSAKVLVTVTDAEALEVATISCGWVRVGTRGVCVWKPRARGVYTLSFSAFDRAGNRTSGTTTTTLRVR